MNKKQIKKLKKVIKNEILSKKKFYNDFISNQIKVYDFKVLLVNIDSFLEKQHTVWNYKDKSINEEGVNNLIFILFGEINEKKIKKIVYNIKEFKKNNPILMEGDIKIKLIQELFSIINPNKKSLYDLYKLLDESLKELRLNNLNLIKEKIILKKNIFITTNKEKDLLEGLHNFHYVYKKKRRNEDTEPCVNNETYF